MPFKFKKGEIIKSQARKIVHNVFEFFASEAKEKALKIPLHKPCLRTCLTTGVSDFTLRKIKREVACLVEDGVLLSPGKTRKKKSDGIAGQPSKNPSDPDYVPSVFDTSSKNTSPRKTSTTPPADDTESDKTTQVWTSLLQLQPITSEAGSSGLSEPSAQNQKPEEPEKPSTKAAVTGIWKSKTKPKPKPRPRKRPRTPSPPPVESKIIDPLKLCVVKMEIEDDGYNQNEEESFLASLTPSSSQTSHNDTLSFDSASSIKTEPNQEPTIYKLVPTISESAPTNSTQQDVEVFFKNVAQTVMQLPLYLIEETKTKVSALVYEMVIQAMREGSTNITQHKL